MLDFYFTVSDNVVLPGVNFINILLDNFLYESALRSFSLVTFWLKKRKTAQSTFVQKLLVLNVDEIDTKPERNFSFQMINQHEKKNLGTQQP